jgi:hypothetical protein
MASMGASIFSRRSVGQKSASVVANSPNSVSSMRMISRDSLLTMVSVSLFQRTGVVTRPVYSGSAFAYTSLK